MIQIHPKDNAAVALHPIAKGTCQSGVTAVEDIPSGHKMALKSITKGEDIIKYGVSIGHATTDITPGAWVHTHNMATNLSAEMTYAYEPKAVSMQQLPCATFQGYRRENGKVGIRNEIWIIPAVGCVNDVAKALAAENQDLVGENIDGLYAFPHPYGCSQTGEDHARTRKLLAALAKHPNAGAVLVLHLGCENLTKAQFQEELGDFDPRQIHFITCQEVEDEMEAGRNALKACAAYANQFFREEIPASELIVGMKCGGSDGLSGITANPVVGAFSDLLIAQGGSTVLTEVPEMFGAETMLLNRCVDESVFQKTARMLNGFKTYFLEHNEVVYENPSPGNKAGGITTLEDKSCGCVQKGGTAPIVDVIGYGDQVQKKGLHLLDGPGNDLISATALTAAGAHMILFTTGRGTPFGAPAPTMKIATNTPLATKKSAWIDFNAGVVADGGKTVEKSAQDLLEQVLQVASSKQTKSEEKGYREIAIFKGGVTL